MSEDDQKSQTLTIAERQLRLEERRFQAERLERKADRTLKLKELALGTVVVAILGFSGGVLGAYIQSAANRDVEAKRNEITREIEARRNENLIEIEKLKAEATIKLERQRQDAAELLDRKKFETTLILKATEAPRREDQIRNLRFFVAAGFIQDPERKIENMDDRALPSTGEFLDVNLSPHLDGDGVWAIGFGRTLGVGPTTASITMEQAKQQYIDDMREASAAIDKLVRISLTVDQRDALVSLIWNIGPEAFAQSALLKVINDQNKAKIPEAWRALAKGASGEIPGLRLKRERELVLWMGPKY